MLYEVITIEQEEGDADEEDFASLLEAMQVPGSFAAGSILFSVEKKTLKQTPSNPIR